MTKKVVVQGDNNDFFPYFFLHGEIKANYCRINEDFLSFN